MSVLRLKKKQAFNPYLPSWEYIPDGEPYVFGDRVYVYGSHDFITDMYFAWEIMSAGQHRLTISPTGDMKE